MRYKIATARMATRMNTEHSVHSIIGATDRRHGVHVSTDMTLSLSLAMTSR
jgi:hypothetical protein